MTAETVIQPEGLALIICRKEDALRMLPIIWVDRIQPAEPECSLRRLPGELVPGLAQEAAGGVGIGNPDHDGRVVGHVAKSFLTLTQRKLDSLLLIDEHGHQIKRCRTERQEMLESNSGVHGRLSGKGSVALKCGSDGKERYDRDRTGGTKHSKSNGCPKQERNRCIEAGLSETSATGISVKRDVCSRDESCRQ